MSLSFQYTDQFVDRHIGPSASAISKMCATIGVSSVQELIDKTIPENIRLKEALDLPDAITEYEFLDFFKQLAQRNTVLKSYIGMGYYGTILPTVIKRNILENPGWYTAYTPYQAEIAQGRLEALINFQTVICDLTGMELANASLLDEATAAAEAMIMMYNLRKGKKKNANRFFASDQCHPQTIDLLKTRAIPLGIDLVIGSRKLLSLEGSDLFGENFFGVLLQYPRSDGRIIDHTDFIQQANEAGVMVGIATDLLALTLLKSPGEMGADVVIGSSQRFGVPMGYGGPHAGFFATRDKFKRQIPGRIIGVSKDVHGNKAYRMALQTREQHIKREKATSNICTAQVLLAVIAGMYAVYHGPKGLKAIGQRVHDLTRALDQQLQSLGLVQQNESYFDTLFIAFDNVELLRSIAENENINFRYFENGIGISIDETVSSTDLKNIIRVFEKATNKKGTQELESTQLVQVIPNNLIRTSTYLTEDVFQNHHSEHSLLRYMKYLENKDISLTHSMIALGSCTMKLNATTEMIPVTWDEFSNIHPFVPKEQAKGYMQLFKELTKWLCEITGFAGISLQPNSGAQGEYAGLMVIRAYHHHRGEGHRNIALIPASAHGTNPASAVMAGMKVIVIKCDENGNIDVDDLKSKAAEYSDTLAALLVTYPSTHGVFEESIIEICDCIHQHGGQVYMDGANMNAQVGLTSPANIGADVCHLNLHKTFCIPHGGGGPGVGPIGVGSHLVPFLPGHAVIDIKNHSENSIHAISAAPWGSASILPIPYAYMMLMGGKGLQEATEIAILNANYLRARLEKHYSILYTGSQGFCAHEMIVDFRPFKEIGIEVADIAKRLMDYGFHAPTVSFPVAGTLMIEPTESESLEELDRFCDALIEIKKEIEEIQSGQSDIHDNVIKNAPHTIGFITTDYWDKPYTREKAAFPLTHLRTNKIWPSVGRIDEAHGDRNLICTCTPIAAYEEV